MPEIVTAGIRIKSPEQLFGAYGVTDFDLARYRRMIEQGDGEAAIADFVSRYLVEYVDLYNATMISYMQKAQEGQLDDRDMAAIAASIPLLSGALAELQTSQFEQFINEALGPAVFAEQDIQAAAVRQAILQETLSRFEQQTFGAMAETQRNVLEQIRAMQTAMIIENQKIAELDIVGAALKNEVRSFKEGLLAKFPQYYDALESGNILKSRRFGPDGETVITYNLSDYSEMATRTTLLNVDRTAVEISQVLSGAEVVRYYLRDSRQLKSGKEREICKEILSAGGMLALTQEAADKYGLMTIDEARSRGAMGPHCRHSIKAASQAAVEKLSA